MLMYAKHFYYVQMESKIKWFVLTALLAARGGTKHSHFL